MSLIDHGELAQHHPDDYLSDESLILKYQLDFTKRFGPKHAYGVIDVDLFHAEELCARARVKSSYQSTKGRVATFTVKMNKFRIWRKNIKLYTFIS